MSQSDLDLNRDVRRILVKHWIDLGRLQIRSNSGRLYIRGALQRIQGVPQELTSSVVETIFDDLRRIRQISHVYAEFTNWTNKTGRWTLTEPPSQTSSPGGRQPGATDDSAPSTYVMRPKAE